MGIVTQHISNLIAKQVNDNGLVVWYDPDGEYTEALEALNIQDTERRWGRSSKSK